MNVQIKKRVCICFSGQMRSNSLNPNFNHNDIILNSIEQNLLNDEFKKTFDYDIFISTDNINLDRANRFFGDNLKNINLTEKNWYMNSIETPVQQNYDFFYNQYLKHTKNYQNYTLYPGQLYQYYRLYSNYNMLKNHQKETNKHYDYFILIRPDVRLMQNLFDIFELLEKSNKLLFIEHNFLFIFKNEFEDIFKLIEKYGLYNKPVSDNSAIYKFLTNGGKFYSNYDMCFCSEKQMLDHIYYICIKKNIDYFDSIYGIIYPNFNLVYRENFTYAYLPENHPIYYEKNYIWKSIQDIEFIKNNFNTFMNKYKFEKDEKVENLIKPINVLFINHKIKKCGVYQYGTRLYDILKKSKGINYIFCEVENYHEYIYQLSLFNYDIILYNYHPQIMGWLNSSNIQKKIKNIGLQHDLDENDIFDITLRLDPTLIERENRYNIQRPIFENIDNILIQNKVNSQEFAHFLNYNEGSNVPIFGSFGFCFERKCFHKIIEVVCQNYDDAIIKLVIPNPDTCPSDPDVIRKCLNTVTKPNIKLLIYTDFIEENDLLKFLNSTSMNIFLYESHPNAGVSSVIDYALSVKTPIAICESSWFRHIYSDNICIDKTNIKDIFHNSKIVCDNIRDKFSNKNLIQTVNKIIVNHIF